MNKLAKKMVIVGGIGIVLGIISLILDGITHTTPSTGTYYTLGMCVFCVMSGLNEFVDKDNH